MDLGLGRTTSSTSVEGRLVPDTKARRWVMIPQKLVVLVPAGLGPWASEGAVLVAVVTYVLCYSFFHHPVAFTKGLVSYRLWGIRVCPMLWKEQPGEKQSTTESHGGSSHHGRSAEGHSLWRNGSPQELTRELLRAVAWEMVGESDVTNFWQLGQGISRNSHQI